MNYMAQIADMLGVEFGEKFKLFDTCAKEELISVYWIDENGMWTECPDDITATVTCAWSDILTGFCEIVKLPWKPRRLEGYCYIDRDGLVRQTNWDGMLFDLAMYKLGKIYQTHQEAEAHAEEDKAYWGEIWKELEE